LDGALELLNGYDWGALALEFERATDEHGADSVCPPTLWLGEDLDPMLGLTTLEREAAQVVLDYRREVNVLGLFRFKMGKNVCEMVSHKDLPEVVRRFFAVDDGDFSKILDGLKR